MRYLSSSEPSIAGGGGGIVSGAGGSVPLGASAISPWLTAGSQVLGSALRSTTGPSRADAANTFDNSGFAVNFGSGSASTSNRKSLPFDSTTVMIIAGLGTLAFMVWAKRKKHSK